MADILREINALYTDPTEGFNEIARTLDVDESNALAPREKITCLLIGNHSAGKSSFINCRHRQCGVLATLSHIVVNIAINSTTLVIV